jgi:hypothetical protein
MNPITRVGLRKFFFGAVIVLAAGLLLGTPGAWGATQYMDDGAVPNARGGFDLPEQGQCWGDGAYNASMTTRAACIALRLPYATSALCTAGTSPTVRTWSTGSCNDLVNTTQATCEAQPDRMWNAATNTCAVVMLYDDRNDVSCVLHGGTWVTTGVCTGTWVMPARTAYNPPLLTGNGTGDQCLRCHNSRTQYNSPRVRDTEDTMFMGHKNMVRKVTPGQGWGGPAFECTNGSYTTEEACFDNGGNWVPKTFYPTDDTGNPFNWNTGRITTGTGTWDLTWIYGDWLGPMPRAIYKTDPSTSTVCSDPRGTSANCASTYGGTMIANAGAAYSCGRCHATGWTSDATIQNAAGINGKEPETSFPGITWDRNTAAGFGVVNLSGGVSGDPNKYSSWDVWGISCTRCHSSAIDTTTGNTSTPPQYSAPAGMSTHHSNLTAPDAGGGVCTDTRWTAEAQCTANGGSWLTACSVNPTAAVCTTSATTQAACVAPNTWVSAPGWCSNAFFTDQTSCTSNGTCNNALYSTQATCTAGSGTWTAYAWQDGFCRAADPTGTTCGTGATYRANGTQQSCLIAGANWSYTKCSVAGVCNLGTTYTTAQTCSDAGGQWRFATDIIRCDDAGGRWTGSNSNRGQIITKLCMDCHRQETAGLPNGATSTDGVNVNYALANPSTNLKVGQYHSTLAFVSHPTGNQFLNSPHAKFSPTATFPLIATGKFNYAMTGEYKSYFMTDGEAAGTGNGCTGCHEIHTSTVTGEEPFREECTECHAGPYKKDLTTINHLWGKGTPMQDAATDESTACESCHMPEGQHLFRINTDPSYSTIPPGLATATTSAACTALGGTWTASSSTCSNVNANTATEGTYANAVWVDIDSACGQCHGGGTSFAQTTGSVATGSKVLTVASAAGFVAGQRIQIADAGNFTYEDSGPVRGDFDSYIASVVGNTINLIGTAPIGVTNVAVRQNPTVLVEPGRYAPYYTKAQLADVAKGMHASGATNFPVTFSTTVDSLNPLRITADASVTCDGPCPTFTYEWNWGDATAFGNTDPAVHTYGAAGTYPVTLTIRQAGLNVGSSTRSVTVVASNFPPIADGTCTWFPNTWTMQFQDASSDENMATLQVVVDWGDASAKSNVTPGGTASKVYGKVGTFAVVQKDTDNKPQSASNACGTATPAYFAINGTVFTPGGTTGLGGARITLFKNGIAQTAVTSATNGTYNFPNLRPATYTLTVSRSGYTFPTSTLIGPVTVGPTQTKDITSTGTLSSKTPSSTIRIGVRQ